MAHKSDYNRSSASGRSQLTNTQATAVNSNSPRVAGKLLLQPNAFRREWVKAREYADQCTYSSYTTTSFPGYVGLPYAASLKTKVSDDAAIKFFQEVGGIRANLIDMYRTRAETISMVAKRLRDVVKAARAVRRGNFSRAEQIFKKKRPARLKKGRPFSENWLEWSYGWAPLLGDIYTLCNEAFPEIVLEAKIRCRDFTYGKLDNSDFSFWNSWTFYTWRAESSVTIKTKIRIKDSDIKAAADLGLTNPMATAWEAVPWSFVVDWVLPIGTWLESFTSLSGLEFLESSVTQTTTVTSSSVTRVNPKFRRQMSDYSPGNSDAVVKEKVRSLGIPATRPFPRFQNPFSTSHLSNAIALYRTNVRR